MSAWVDQVKQLKRDLLRRILNKHGGNRSAAARELGIGRTEIYRLINSLDAPDASDAPKDRELIE